MLNGDLIQTRELTYQCSPIELAVFYNVTGRLIIQGNLSNSKVPPDLTFMTLHGKDQTL